MLQERAEHLNNQAIMFASRGDFAEAIACFVRAITIEKDNELLWFNLGVTYKDAGKFFEAREAFQKAYELDPSNAEFVDMLSIMYAVTNDYENAESYCFEGLDEHPYDAHLWNTLGAIFFKQTEYESAVTAFEYAVSLDPYYYNAVFNLRDTYDELGNEIGKSECQKKLDELKRGGKN